jgi:hypothetical protein
MVYSYISYITPITLNVLTMGETFGVEAAGTVMARPHIGGGANDYGFSADQHDGVAIG